MSGQDGFEDDDDDARSRAITLTGQSLADGPSLSVDALGCNASPPSCPSLRYAMLYCTVSNWTKERCDAVLYLTICHDVPCRAKQYHAMP